MGTRHNRKRTRSRPRNRFDTYSSSSHSPSASFHDTASFSLSPAVFGQQQHRNYHQARLVGLWDQQYSAWQSRQRPQQTQKASSSSWPDSNATPNRNGATVDSQCIRMFGGDADDEAGLCAPMLQVVLDLFDGRIDYEDD